MVKNLDKKGQFYYSTQALIDTFCDFLLNFRKNMGKKTTKYVLKPEIIIFCIYDFVHSKKVSIKGVTIRCVSIRA